MTLGGECACHVGGSFFAQSNLGSSFLSRRTSVDLLAANKAGLRADCEPEMHAELI
jgi:hypothetical protein